jgi:hypothetical protein
MQSTRPSQLHAIHAARSAARLRFPWSTARSSKSIVTLWKPAIPRYTLMSSGIGNVGVLPGILLHGVRVDRGSLLVEHAWANVTSMKLLLEHGADVKQGHQTPCHALRAVALEGRIEDGRQLLERWPEGASQTLPSSKAPLYVAAMNGRTDLMRLLETWPNGNRETAYHLNTALPFTATSGEPDTMSLLLESRSAGPWKENELGNTPWHLAVSKGKREVMRVFLESFSQGSPDKNGHGITPLYVAAMGDRPKA